MRLALIVPGFSANADDWCIPALRDFVSALALTDEVVVFALRYPPRAGRYSVFGAEVIALGGGTNRRGRALDLWRRAVGALASEHRRRPFEVIHAFWADEPGTVAAVAGKLLRVPCIVSLAGGELVGFPDIAYGGQLALLQRAKTDLALRLADEVTVGSRYEQHLAVRQVRRLQAHPPVIRPLGVDVRRFAPVLDSRPPAETGEGIASGRRVDDRSMPTVLNVASLVAVKDQAALLAAVGEARHHGRPFRLDVVGDGPLRARLNAVATALGVSDLVRFRGAVPHDRLPDVYRSADLFVVSSRHEAQCLAALEAAASGVVVVGTTVGVVPDLAPPGGTVAVGDSSGVAQAILRVFDQTGRYERVCQDTRTRVLADFSLESCTAAFREVYVSVVDRTQKV